MATYTRTRAVFIDRKGDRAALVVLLGLALAFQSFLLMEVGASRPESIPIWFVIASESFDVFAGICILFLSIELSRIQRVRSPLIVAVAFGITSIISAVLALGAVEESLTAGFLESLSLDSADLFRFGVYVLVAPLSFLPFASERVKLQPDRFRNVFLFATLLLVVLAGLMLVGDPSWNSNSLPSGSTPGRNGDFYWFRIALAALCFAAVLSNLRAHLIARNRLLLGAAILLALIGLGQLARIYSVPPNWFWLYFNRLVRLDGYLVFGLILLGEYIRGYRSSVADSARATSELARKVDYLKMLTESTRVLGSTLDVGKVEEAVVEAAIRLLNGRTATLLVYDEATGLLVPRCHRGLDIPIPSAGFQPTLGVAGSVFTTQKAEFVADVSRDPRAFPRRSGIENAGHSLMSVPLVVRDRSIGILNVSLYSQTVSSPPTQEQVELLSALASHAAVALENAHLFERTALMHEQLRLAGLRLEAVIDAMPEGVCIAEAPSGRIIVANKAAERILGPLPASGIPLENRPSRFHLSHPNGGMFADEELPIYRSIHKGEVCIGVEMDVSLGTGQRLTTLTNSAPIEDVQGNVIGAVTVFQDITSKKRVERMKDDFLSLVSHDLKTPLTSIKGYASTLLQEDVAWAVEEQKRFLRIIAQESDRLTRRVQDLLDSSSIVSGNLRINKSWCSPRDLIEVTLERLEHLLREREVRVEITEDLAPLPVDAARFKQVVLNLIENAVKFSAQGSEIVVRAWAIDDSMLVSVADAGVGIAPDNLPRVFDKFSQVHNPSVCEPGGKGLGLAICQGIVEAHGGHIWVDSCPGKGSVFTFSLPVSNTDFVPDE